MRRARWFHGPVERIILLVKLKPFLDKPFQLKTDLDKSLQLKTDFDNSLELKPVQDKSLQLKTDLDNSMELKTVLDNELNRKFNVPDHFKKTKKHNIYFCFNYMFNLCKYFCI